MKSKPTMTIFISLFIAVILFLTLRGIPGNPGKIDLNTAKWTESGPFELSPERGRFALTFSLVEDRSFYFDVPVARFVIPDLAISRGNYVSLFAPLLSFIVIPGYVIGKFLGASQVGTYSIIAIFALLNALLIRLISIRLGAKPIAATLASLVFIFGTPAFAYGVNLYQHHISTSLILLSIFLLLNKKNIRTLLIVFLLSASSIPLDYPNLIFVLPIIVYALYGMISFKKIKERFFLKVNLLHLITPVVMILPILFFLWFNYESYGNPFQISGTLKTVKGIGADGKPLTPELLAKQPGARFDIAKLNREKTISGFFKSRALLNGFYIHFISPDRGIIYFTPVILFGIIGVFLAYKRKVAMVTLLLAVMGANVILYSMWGDPWGGWAFGSRYLVPSYAILSIFIALLLTYSKRLIFLISFTLVAFYSIGVNTLGAITTSAMPPKVEVLELEKLSGTVQKFTFERNWDFLVSGRSKSFVFQALAKNYVTSLQYYRIILSLILATFVSLLTYYVYIERRKK